MEERRTNDNPAPRQEPPMNRSTDGFTFVDHASMSEFERRWHTVQSDFVEDPRRAVSEAGKLMAEVMDHVGRNLRQRGSDIGKTRDGESDTEAMRLEMRRYKDLMQRMLHGDTQATAAPQARPPVPDRTAPQSAPQSRPPANPSNPKND
jgi:hypothetical protein